MLVASRTAGTAETNWRARLGLIVPSWNSTMEFECARMVQNGVSLHVARITHTDDSLETLRHEADEAPDAAQLLAHADVDVVCFGCTGASFIEDGIDSKIIADIESATGTRATTTSTSIKLALQQLGAKKIALVTPYSLEINGILTRFLNADGFDVVSQSAMGIEKPAFLPPEAAYQAVIDTFTDEADAVLISCTNLRTLEVIERLEAELNVPVVTSNSAVVWNMSRMCSLNIRPNPNCAEWRLFRRDQEHKRKVARHCQLIIA